MAHETKKKILETARSLFAENGYHETSMATIARETGIGKGTLYWHFNSKEDLFKELIMDEGQALFEKTRALAEGEKSVEESIFSYIKLKVDFFEGHRDLARIVINNSNLISQEIRDKVLAKRKEMIENLSKIVERGIEEGIFRDTNPRDTAIAIMHITNSANSFFIFEGSRSRKEKVKFLYDFIMHGILKQGVLDNEK